MRYIEVAAHHRKGGEWRPVVTADTVVLALLAPFRTMSLAWQITFIVALCVLFLSVMRGLNKVAPRIQTKWNPFRKKGNSGDQS